MVDSSLTTNTSKVVAFQDAVEKMNRESNHIMDIWGPLQRIILQFKYGKNISVEHLTNRFESWTVHQAAHSSMDDESSHEQFQLVLSIELKSVDKSQKASSTKKGTRVFSSPSL